MKTNSRLIVLVLSLLLVISLAVPASADVECAEITSSGRTFRLSVSECRTFTRSMYMVVIKGYNIAADSEGDGFTVDADHLPFSIAIGSDLDNTIAWNGIQMTSDDTTPFVFPLESGAAEPAVVLIKNKGDSWADGWVYDIASRRLMTAAEWIAGSV